MGHCLSLWTVDAHFFSFFFFSSTFSFFLCSLSSFSRLSAHRRPPFHFLSRSCFGGKRSRRLCLLFLWIRCLFFVDFTVWWSQVRIAELGLFVQVVLKYIFFYKQTDLISLVFFSRVDPFPPQFYGIKQDSLRRYLIVINSTFFASFSKCCPCAMWAKERPAPRSSGCNALRHKFVQAPVIWIVCLFFFGFFLFIYFKNFLLLHSLDSLGISVPTGTPLIVISRLGIFFWVLPDGTGFPWVLLGSTGIYWDLLGFTRFYRVLLGFTGFYWVSLGFTGFYWDLLGFTRFYWM